MAMLSLYLKKSTYCAIFAAITILLFMLTSCSESTKVTKDTPAIHDSGQKAVEEEMNSYEKVLPSMVKTVTEDGEKMVYLGEKPYTGIVWADDESCYQVFENGRITGGAIFHKNGKVALYVIEMKKSYATYDEEGNPMDEEEFRQTYMDLLSETKGKLPIE